MKTKLSILLVVGLVLISLTTFIPAANAAAGDEPTEITLEESPIDVALSTLAQMAGLNIYIDQKITATPMGPDGKPTPLPKVTIKWKDISPNKAFVALVENYGYQAVLDPKTGVTRISIKDPNLKEPLLTRVITLKYANVTNLVPMVKATLAASSQVQAEPRTSQLIVVATESELANVSNLLARIDGPVQQVLIEARFMETAKNPKSLKGIDWSGTLREQNFTFGNGVTSGSTDTVTPGAASSTTTTLPSGRTVTSTALSPLDQVTTLSSALGAGGLSADTARGFFPHTAFLNADGIKAVLSFLNTDADTESIATPRAVTQEGVPTELSVVRNVPIFEEQQGSSQGGVQQASTVKPNYQLLVKEAVLNEVGVKLVVTPRVVGNSDVQLELKPEISAVETIQARVILGGKVNESPIFSRRKLQTTATVPNGSTLVLGGLLSDETTKSYTKVPLLGDIPVLGYAFRKDSKERNKRNLLIFVTPTIVDTTDYQKLEGARFLKTRPAEKPDLEESAWDTGKPKDKARSMF
jgi:type II secretory pathway component GspD/PulD (secretin)